MNVSATSKPTSSNNASFLANLFQQHDSTSPLRILPIISLAISRDASGINNACEVLIGGFLNSNNTLVNTSSCSTFPISLSSLDDATGGVYADTSMQYTIPITTISARNTDLQEFHINATAAYHMSISTSDTVISLPPSLASAVNSLFIPPGFLAANNSTYYVQCDSIAPRLEFVIGNHTFLINPVDLKRHTSQTLCVSSITANSHGHYVLGDLFLRNVLLTLDFRSNTLSLSPRPYYRS
jgi:hypothetical protein